MNWSDVRKEIWRDWKFMFVIQLVIGSHAMYSMEDLVGLDFFTYALILLSTAAIISTVLLLIVYLILFILGAIAFAIWGEK